MRDVLFDFEGQVSAAGDRGGEFNVQGRLEEGTSCYEGVVFSVFPADVDVIFFHSGYEVSGQDVYKRQEIIWPAIRPCTVWKLSAA